jgi:hypothetical protein
MAHRKGKIRAQHRGPKRRFREMPMRRRPTPQQLDLFAHPTGTDPVPPDWQALPQEARVTLTKLLVRLILDHAAGAQGPHPMEARHDA